MIAAAALACPSPAAAEPAVGQPTDAGAFCPVGIRGSEMPELSGHGAFSIGTRTSPVAAGERSIEVRLWYPAVRGPEAAAAVYRHTVSTPSGGEARIEEQGCAVEGAQPVAGSRFPLVVLSHGFGGWGTSMSRLGEALASRGYVVASIDHRDSPVRDLASFAASFGSVLSNRASDQRIVLRGLLDGTIESREVLGIIDSQAVGLIGYSMGGYGVLSVAGAPVDEAAPALKMLPAELRARIAAPDAALAKQVDAVIALAPWGGQPDAAVWTDASLARISAPLLLISGDQDDIVGFEHGVKRVFSAARGSDRYLLVYREAAHNIAGNAIVLPPHAGFAAIEYASEPVWRKDRLEAINQHFITAFLDRTLKRDSDKAAYLDVPTVASNEGVWPSEFGRQWGETRADDDQPGYWRGFQRRWARGMEMHHRGVGE